MHTGDNRPYFPVADSIDSTSTLEDDPEPSWDEIGAHFRPGLIASIRAQSAASDTTLQGHKYVRSAAAQACGRSDTAIGERGSFFSAKLGATKFLQDGTLEVLAVSSLEADNSVLACFDYPPPLHVHHVSSVGTRAYLHQPNFLVVRHEGFVLVDCLVTARIITRNSSDPGLYTQDGQCWACPSLQEAARVLGIRHELWTEKSFPRLSDFHFSAHESLRGIEMDGYAEVLAAMSERDEAKRAPIVDALMKLFVSDLTSPREAIAPRPRNSLPRAHRPRATTTAKRSR